MFLNEANIDYIQSRACERITEVLDALGIEYTERHDYLQMACPVHGGDNPRGMFWAIGSDHWECKTRMCHKDPITGPSNSVFGLVRGTMSRITQQKWNFYSAVNFVIQALNLNLQQNSSITQQDIEISKLLKRYRRYKQQPKIEGILLSNMIPILSPDTVYYPNRGISSDIIAKYHISYCGTKGKPFYNRAFFPILDETGRYIVGWSGRSIYEKCNNCKMHHDPSMTNCPDIKYRGLYVKWKHSSNFKADACLYNYWYAKPFIGKTGVAILCEGPGDVWAYEAANIRNSVALLGLNISKKQRLMLQNAGALTVICTFDNDNAGRQALKGLNDSLKHHFRVFCVTPDTAEDIGAMVPSDIAAEIGPILQQTSRTKILEQTNE